METWNIYSQNTPSTPSSTWLCPQNNNPGSDWLHPQNNTTERERNENTALATPTRFVVEYNDVNQNSSSGSYFNNPYQEMERLFENSFLKLGNPEDLLNNDMYNNDNLSSWLNANETVIPVTTASNIQTTNNTNSPTPSLVTDDDQEQLYNNLQKEQRIQNPGTTSASFIQSPIFADDNQQEQQRIQYPISTLASVVNENQQILNKMPSCSQSATFDENQDILQKNQREQQIMTTTAPSKSANSSPISPLVSNKSHNFVQQKDPREQRYPMTTSSTFYQPALTSQHPDNQDQYLQAKKHDPKQLLLPLTTSKASMDGTMTVAITSPSPSLATDEDMEQCRQTKTKSRRQSYQDFQLSISTNDLPMQQPSPASSEYYSSSTKSPPSSNDTTPKQKKRRVSQRRTSSKKTAKFNEEALISPIEEPYSEQDLMAVTTDESSPTMVSNDVIIASTSSEAISTSSKRNSPDDGNEETPEEKRARLLERNRIAAAKCRQKKKQAQECLQQQASDLTQKNTTMHSLVNDLREEALKLKNQLLAHSTCNCNVIQEYVRTSGQFAFARGSYTK